MSSLFSLSIIQWLNNYEQQIVATNAVHIFKIHCSMYANVADNLTVVLSATEIEKMNRFLRTDDAKRYALGKYFTRKILGKKLNIEPKDINFLLAENKKPYINDISFNISHSGDYVVLAISKKAIGIDVEIIKNHFDYDPLAEVCFTQNERKLITNLENFYTFWTRKEAILKATGEGLIDNLLDIECIADKITRHKKTYVVSSHLIDQKHLLSLAYEDSLQKICFWNVTIV